MKNKVTRKSAWEWYSVKLLYECNITGNPNPQTIDDNFTLNHKTYEESIMLVRAQSFDHAYSVAEKRALQNDISYVNPYEQKVSWKFIAALDAFSILEDKLETGVELYSRFIRVPKGTNIEEIKSRLYPELEIEEQPDYNWIIRNKDFNKRPGEGF